MLRFGVFYWFFCLWNRGNWDNANIENTWRINQSLERTNWVNSQNPSGNLWQNWKWCNLLIWPFNMNNFWVPSERVIRNDFYFNFYLNLLRKFTLNLASLLRDLCTFEIRGNQTVWAEFEVKVENRSELPALMVL